MEPIEQPTGADLRASWWTPTWTRQQPADPAAATWWAPPAPPCRVLPDLHATTDRAALLPSACRSGRGRHSAWTVNHWPLSTMPFVLIEQR